MSNATNKVRHARRARQWHRNQTMQAKRKTIHSSMHTRLLRAYCRCMRADGVDPVEDFERNARWLDRQANDSRRWRQTLDIMHAEALDIRISPQGDPVLAN